MLGWTIGLSIGSFMLRFGVIGIMVGGGLAGLCVGVAQWLALQTDRAWLTASAVGGVLAALPAALCAFTTLAGGIGFLLVGAIFGAIFGTAQWMLLRGESRAGWWIAANGLAGALCGWLTLGFNPLGLPLLCSLGPLVFGLLTGYVHRWLVAAEV
ncbi:MAG: hypothetical protein K8L99_19835 [Anaerolineae bacterium]|nr:hypothetical protein [Anaerolineae bacterium]